MKKTLLLSSLFAAFLACQVSAQTPTATISGTSLSGVAPGTMVNVNMQLAVSQLPTNLNGVDLLLETPTTGANSGVGFFTVQFGSGSAAFPFGNSPSTSVASFDTPTTTGANAGFTVSTPSVDLGAFNNGQPGATTPFTGTFDTLKFTVAPNTPAGTYNFQATLGFPTDTNGSFVTDVGNDGPAFGNYAVTSAPTFTITVVPEPATWSLLALGGLGSFGLNILRRRKA